MSAAPLRRDLAGAGLLGAALFSLAHLTPPTLFDGMDWQQLHLPAHHFMAAALRAGRLPLWNPYVALGRPFLADIEMAVFYPPNLLYVLLEPTLAYSILSALHYALAAWGTLHLSRHLGAPPGADWLSAALFPASQALVSRLQSGQSHYVQAIAWLPLLVLLASRLRERVSAGRIAGLAVTLALQLLCGHPQVPWLTWLGLLAFTVGGTAWDPAGFRRTATVVGALGIALACALGLAGPMLLPFLEMVGQGNRVLRSLSSAGGDPVGLFMWSSLAVANGSERTFYWEYNLYAGACTLVGGLAGLLLRAREPRVRGLVAVAAVSFLLASGTATPAFAVLYHLVPGASVFRFPARAAVLTVLALVAGLGLLLAGREPRRRSLFALAGGLSVALLLVATHPRLVPAGLRAEPAGPSLFWLAAATAALSTGVLATRARVRRAALLAVVAVALGDVAVHAPAAKQAWALSGRREGETSVRDVLLARGLYDPRGVPPRIAVPSTVVRANSGVFFGWSTFAGYQAVWLARVWEYLHGALGLTPGPESTFVSGEIYARGPFPYDSMSLVAGIDPRTPRLVSRPDPDPRAYVALAARTVPHWRDAVAAMRDGHDFHRVALLEAGNAAGLPATPPAAAVAKAAIVSFAPEEVVVETDASRPGLLVLAEPWYPGWRAWVDGRPAPCLPANAWMRAVGLPAGAHRVVLRFHSRLLGGGTVLCAATALLLLGLCRRARRLDAGRRAGGKAGTPC